LKKVCEPIVVGLDLAGVESRPTGFCVLEGLKAATCILYGDKQVVDRTLEAKPRLVAIDAPLSLPEGRKSIEERTDVHLRECDKELLKRRIKFFPITIGPMRLLTARGIRLKERLENERCKVIEVYPGGAQDVLGIPRKQRSLNRLKNGLKKLGVEGLAGKLSDHELDAVTCAYVGLLFLKGKSCAYGRGNQVIVMPAGHACETKNELTL
jgi:predicted nuclease with RNAse H fold